MNINKHPVGILFRGNLCISLVKFSQKILHGEKGYFWHCLSAEHGTIHWKLTFKAKIPATLLKLPRQFVTNEIIKKDHSYFCELIINIRLI